MLKMKNYRLGLSWMGLAAVVLVMLPNLFFVFRTPVDNPLQTNAAGYWLWDVLENIGRFGVMSTLIVVVNKEPRPRNRMLLVIAALLLFMYYVLWVAYFMERNNGLSLVGMAVFPSLFFLLVAWQQKNLFALAFGLLFGITHTAITAANFL